MSVWRGFWNIQNAVLLPDDPLASHLVSWGGGNALCLLLVVLEKPLTTLSEKAGQRNIGKYSGDVNDSKFSILINFKVRLSVCLSVCPVI